ncbi:MAG: O-antigen ligase family protein [Clostridia bacterium]|nr:O-antigen ligase family protein [Clostridia bacterium]
MKTSLRQIQQDLRLPYQRALLLIALVPLFPEYISFFLVLAAAFFAYKDIRESKQSIAVGTIGKMMLVYIAYMAVTLIYSKDRLSTLVTIGVWLFFFLAYLILYNLLTDSDRYDSIMLYITGVAGVVGLIACLQYRIGFYTNGNPIQVWEWLDKIVYSFLPIEVSKTPYILRACSTFSNPNVLSMYLMSVAPFVVYFNFYERREGLRMFCRICLFLCLGGVTYSFSRGGYVALLILLLALMVLNIRHKFATVSLYALCGVLLIPDEVVKRFISIIPGISIGGQILENVTNSVGGSSGSSGGGGAGSGEIFNTTAEIINNGGADLAISDRYRIWVESFDQIADYPIFGQGMGTGVSEEILKGNGLNAIHTHNIVLELLLGGGIFALIIMLLIGFKAAKNGVELLRNGYGYSFWIGFAVLGFVGCFIIQGMVDYPLLTPKLVCNFMMIMALVERANILYVSKAIPVRQHLKKRLRKVKEAVR